MCKTAKISDKLNTMLNLKLIQLMVSREFNHAIVERIYVNMLQNVRV